MNDEPLENTIPADMELIFSQVVFVNIPHSYPINVPVKCCYTLTGGMKGNPKDWIGIFKVGWNSTQNYYSYVWAQSSEHDGTEPLQQEVDFGENNLPKDDGEFYQFCYVDSSGQIRGASTPFSFQNPTETNLDCSLEKDLLVITTQEQTEQMEKEREDLLVQVEHLKEENKIVRNELDERLREICQFRILIDKMKASNKTETLPANEQITQEHQPLFQTLAENENPEESLSPTYEKYRKALQKITMLKEDRTELMQKLEAQQAEISQVNSRIKEAVQGYNTLDDHLQLLKVDLQSSRKENERLQAENLAMERELEQLRGENKDFRAALSQQAPVEGDKGSAKMQIQALLSQLTDARGTLRKEIKNSNEANQRADRAERQVTELKTQLEQMKSEGRKETNQQTEAQIKEAQRRIDEQAHAAETEQLEKENQKLRNEVERLQKALFELQIASVAAASQHQHSHSRYECIKDLSATPTDTKNKSRVCQHCLESFPNLTEDELEAHEQDHKVCPFCTLICDNMKQQEFEDHVYGHEG